MFYKFLKSSTRSLYAEARKSPDFSLPRWLHGYLYARFTYLYIGICTGEHPLARITRPFRKILQKAGGPLTGEVGEKIKDEFAETYHGKVLPLKLARKLVTVNQDIELGDLKQVVPYAEARSLILHHPDHIAVLECPCRTSRPDPCLPLDVCLVVGEPFVGFVVEHHPNRSRRISQSEAVEILQAASERGLVHNAFFKDAMLGRFYAICNCCSCCCGAMQAWTNGIPMLASSGYLRHLDPDRCKGCGICVEACQFGAIEMKKGMPVLDESACLGCGVCVRKCGSGALTLIPAPDKGVPLDLDVLAGRG